MKLIFALLFTSLMSAQATYHAYVPIRTYHFNRDPMDLWFMEKNEGGNVGIVVMRREGLSEVQLGVVNNSYGYLSIVAMGGVTKRVGWFRIGASVGIASGYRAYYWQFRHTDTKPKNIMTETGILPQANINISLEKHKFSPLIVVSPYFINAGIRYNFK